MAQMLTAGSGEPSSALAPPWPERLSVVGCGNMGGAILHRWLAAGLPPEHVTVIDPAASLLPAGVRIVADIEAAATGNDSPIAAPDLLLLAIKPQMLAALAPAINAHIGAQTVLMSILAGTPLPSLRQHFPDARQIVRTMPNLAVTQGMAAMLIADDPALDAAAKARAEALFAPLGISFWLAEEQMAVATALAGSGPAFLFRFIDALAAAGTALGLPEEQAARLALTMVRGASELAQHADVSPGALAERVASPGGVTRAGLDVIDAAGQLHSLLRDTLRAARDRDHAMAKEFGGID